MVPHRVLVDGHEEEGLGQPGNGRGLIPGGRGDREKNELGGGVIPPPLKVSPPLHKNCLT